MSLPFKITLMVDIGNSIISFGFFKNEEIVERFDISSSIDNVALLEKPLRKFIAEKNINYIDGGLICSVVPMFSKSVQKIIKNIFDIVIDIMDSSYFSMLEMKVDNKKEVGSDLVSDIIAAKKIYGNSLLIVDLGTISKIMVVDSDGVFIGTSFFPGINISIETMREKTALLPGIELNKKPDKLIGNNTIEAIATGIYYGNLSYIEEYANKIEKWINYPLKKILTGGNSSLFSDNLPDFIIDKDLVLKGTYFLYVSKEKRR